jgi:thiosulfate/3-mercaptopyruvate sulfurtransferase
MSDWTTLIPPEELAAHLNDDDLCMVDCRFDLSAPEAGQRAWQQSRIPGAVYADLESDLSGTVSETTGRHPLPAVDDFIAWLERNGIDRDTRIACYDDAGGAFAARLWWLLRHWLGHPAVAVLDGGFARWRAEGWPLEEGGPTAPSASQYPCITPAPVTVDADTLAGEDTELQLVDARAADRFRGETEPIDPVAGHVPGALNRPFAHNLGEDGRWRGPEELRAQWRTLLGERASESIVHMCGSGVTACHNLLAMEHAGFPGSRLYPGSWSEWIRDPHRQVERDPPLGQRPAP